MAGRPTKFKPQYVEQGYKLAIEGFTDQQMADFFGVSRSTLALWKKEHPEFSDTIKKGKDDFDSAEVEYCLLQRACGFKYVETTREIAPHADPQTGKAKLRITKKVTKYAPPDVTAQIFWLKNRQPNRWRDVQKMEHSGYVLLAPQKVKTPSNAGR